MPLSSHMGLYFDWSEKIRCIVHGSISYPPIGSRAVKRVLETWRSRSNVGVPKRLLGFYESPQEVLVSTDHHCVVVAQCSNCACRRDRNSPSSPSKTAIAASMVTLLLLIDWLSCYREFLRLLRSKLIAFYSAFTANPSPAPLPCTMDY